MTDRSLFVDFPLEPGTVPLGLGAAMAGGKGPLAKDSCGHQKVATRQHGYYPTPPEVTRAFLLAEISAIRAALDRNGELAFWEMCGRGGAIDRVARTFGLPCIASDLVADPDNHVVQLDARIATFGPSVGFTNPAFGKVAADILLNLLITIDAPAPALREANQKGMDYLAVLLPSNFFNKGNKNGTLDLWQRRRPSRRWDMAWRVDFTGGGDPTMTTTWFVWDRAAPPHICIANLLGKDGPIDAALPIFNGE